MQIGVCPLPTRAGSVRAGALYLGTVPSMSIIDSVPTVLEIMLMLRRPAKSIYDHKSHRFQDSTGRKEKYSVHSGNGDIHY
jgi:hypothetical protein